MCCGVWSAISALRLEVTAALQKEVKSLDEDSWMFTGPRSRINLISKTGILNLILHSLNIYIWFAHYWGKLDCNDVFKVILSFLVIYSLADVIFINW